MRGGMAVRTVRIRPRRADDDPALLAIENRAAVLFRAHGHPEVADAPLPDVAALRALAEGGDCLVAVDGDDRPAGFAVAAPLGVHMHLRELSVDPAAQRRGIGTALVEAVVALARERRCAGVSLTTFRDVPFNEPFYERLGFAELALDDAPQVLREVFGRELPAGSPAAQRVLMVHRP